MPANDVLAGLEESAAEGRLCYTRKSQAKSASGLDLVSSLAGERPTLETEYLMGAQPSESRATGGEAMVTRGLGEPDPGG
jgi:hypothetical protein